MPDVREARTILGVREDASRDEIERKYTVLLKKHRATAAQDENQGGEKVDIAAVTQAYNLLMGYEEPQTEEENRAPNPVLTKMGIDEKKARNFLHYYKFHILIGIVLLFVMVFTIRGCVLRVDPDLNVAFVGNIYLDNSDLLKQKVEAAVPEITEPGFDNAFLAKDMDGQQAYAMQMKAMVLFGAADTDLFILDKENFRKYAAQGAFMNLDEWGAELKVDMNLNSELIVGTEEDPAKHLYGVNIGKNKFLAESGVIGEELIAAIPVRSKNVEKAKKLVEFLLK